jgi:hypothetical protein
MPVEVNRPGDSLGEKPRLSGFGRRVVAVVLLLAIVATAVVYSRIQANRRKAELADQVLSAVERSKVVSANALSAAGADDAAQAALKGYVKRIDDARQVKDKAAAAQEMITFSLGQVHGIAAQVDELNGARNRLLLALQQYNDAR